MGNLRAAEFLQSGTTQICAGYALNGPATMLVLATGHGVNGFPLDTDIREVMLTHPNLTSPADTVDFATNSSNKRFREKPNQRNVEKCIAASAGPRTLNFHLRWVASMVAEQHRILMPGVFDCPEDIKDPSKAGELRLL